MPNFARFPYKYEQIDASVDIFNANTDKTIIVIIVVFCFIIQPSTKKIKIVVRILS